MSRASLSTVVLGFCLLGCDLGLDGFQLKCGAAAGCPSGQACVGGICAGPDAGGTVGTSVGSTSSGTTTLAPGTTSAATTSASAGTSSGGQTTGGASAGSAGSTTGATATSTTTSSGGVPCASGWTASVFAQNPLPNSYMFGEPQALALVGQVLYVADLQAMSVFEINTSDTSPNAIDDQATPTPVSLAPVDGGLLVGNTGNDIWLVLAPAAQSQFDLVTDGQGAFDFGGLTANSAGEAYYVDTQGPSGCFYKFSFLDPGSSPISSTPYDNDPTCNTGFLNGPIGSAKFNLPNNPQGLAFDPSGTVLYVVDEGNGLIRAVNVDAGQVTTLAGVLDAGADSDGLALDAGFASPVAIAVDAKGDIFVAETSGEGAVREITLGPPVMVQTLYDQSCEGLSIGTDTPVGIAVDPAGQNIYISDSESQAVWKLSHP